MFIRGNDRLWTSVASSQLEGFERNEFTRRSENNGKRDNAFRDAEAGVSRYLTIENLGLIDAERRHATSSVLAIRFVPLVLWRAVRVLSSTRKFSDLEQLRSTALGIRLKRSESRGWIGRPIDPICETLRFVEFRSFVTAISTNSFCL